MNWIQSRALELLALVVAVAGLALAIWAYGHHRGVVATAQCQATEQAKADHAKVLQLQTALDAANAANSETARRLRTQKEISDEEAKTQAQEIQALRASDRAARAALARLQRAAGTAGQPSAGASAVDPTTSGRCASAQDIAQLLATCAERYRSLGEQAGSDLESSVSAGRRCEGYYDALTNKDK